MSKRTREQAEFTALWGDGITVSLQVEESYWNDIVSGLQVTVEGNGYDYDGDHYLDVWEFSGGLDGDLAINYIKQGGDDGDDDGVGYLGSPNDVLVKPLPIQAPDPKLEDSKLSLERARAAYARASSHMIKDDN
jgi:hypothetical protein